MVQIEEWVYDTKSDKKLEIKINSVGVRKELDRRIKETYLGTGMFFTWNRAGPDCYTEKSKRFNQKQFLRGYAKKSAAKDQEKVATLGFFD